MTTYDELRRLVAAFAESPEPSFVSALDGMIVTWNDAMANLLCVPAWQVLGRPCFMTIGGRSPTGDVVCRQSCHVVCEAKAGRSAPPMDLVVEPGPAAARRRLRFHVHGLKSAGGSPLGLLHTVEDVTEQRDREEIGRRFLAVCVKAGKGRGRNEPVGGLTEREQQVLGLLAAGHGSREVAAHLGIAHATARTHIQRILGKLGVHTRTAALARALAGLRMP